MDSITNIVVNLLYHMIQQQRGEQLSLLPVCVCVYVCVGCFGECPLHSDRAFVGLGATLL